MKESALRADPTSRPVNRRALIVASLALAATPLPLQESTGDEASLLGQLRHQFPELHAFAEQQAGNPALASRASRGTDLLIRSAFRMSPDHLFGLSREAVLGAAAAAVRQDLEHGRIVEIAGWILSESEACLSAVLGSKR